MYGADRSISRSVGVLNAPRSSGLPLIAAPPSSRNNPAVSGRPAWPAHAIPVL
jgi:hypothetical protein